MMATVRPLLILSLLATGIAACTQSAPPAAPEPPAPEPASGPTPSDVTKADPAASRTSGKLIPINSDQYGGITWAAKQAPRLGQPAPQFNLPAASGSRFDSTSALQHGPLIVVFYRGFW